MKSIALDIHTAHLSLALGIHNSSASWSERNSALVTLRDAEGRLGRGEATPLEGYGPDTLDDAKQELSAASGAALAAVQADDDLRALRELANIRSPSARFALESAVLDLRGRRTGRSFAEVLSSALALAGVATHDRPHQATQLIDLADWAVAVVRARCDGISTFKVKIGRAPSRELSLLRELSQALTGHERLRLDANGAFLGEDEILPFAALGPEFIEEPLGKLGTPRELSCPLAIDETTFRETALAREWLLSGFTRAVVLKPMTLGLLESFGWLQLARGAGCEVVVSHCFDGQLAMRLYRALANRAGSRTLAMGLGPQPGLGLWSEFATADV